VNICKPYADKVGVIRQDGSSSLFQGNKGAFAHPVTLRKRMARVKVLVIMGIPSGPGLILFSESMRLGYRSLDSIVISTQAVQALQDPEIRKASTRLLQHLSSIYMCVDLNHLTASAILNADDGWHDFLRDAFGSFKFTQRTLPIGSRRDQVIGVSTVTFEEEEKGSLEALVEVSTNQLEYKKVFMDISFETPICHMNGSGNVTACPARTKVLIFKDRRDRSWGPWPNLSSRFRDADGMVCEACGSEFILHDPVSYRAK